MIDTIDAFNAGLQKAGREKAAYPSDEFFQLAGRPLPPYEYYGDFPQLENGVGMLTGMRYEFLEALADAPADHKKRSLALVTGMAARDLLTALAEAFCKKFTQSDIAVYGVKNEFFGEDVTVAGLLTGKDIIAHFSAFPPAQKTLVFPGVMFRSRNERVFLDDVTLEQAEEALGVRAVIADCDAASLLDVFLQLTE